MRRGQPSKNRTDTALEGLAEIFAVHTGRIGRHWDLPHGDRSRFVSFAVAMLDGYLAATELQTGAIAKRWERLKAAEGRGAVGL